MLEYSRQDFFRGVGKITLFIYWKIFKMLRFCLVGWMWKNDKFFILFVNKSKIWSILWIFEAIYFFPIGIFASGPLSASGAQCAPHLWGQTLGVHTGGCDKKVFGRYTIKMTMCAWINKDVLYSIGWQNVKYKLLIVCKHWI